MRRGEEAVEVSRARGAVPGELGVRTGDKGWEGCEEEER